MWKKHQRKKPVRRTNAEKINQRVEAELINSFLSQNKMIYSIDVFLFRK